MPKRKPKIDPITNYRTYVEGLRRSGARLVSYLCPCCNFVIETLVPASGQQYDTMVQCPACRKQHFRVVRCPRSAGTRAAPELIIYWGG